MFKVKCVLAILLFALFSSSALAQIKIYDANKNLKAEVDVKAAAIIQVGDVRVFRKIKGDGQSEKIKYYLESGNLLATVNRDDDSIKLKVPVGQRLWKIKAKVSALKIADNEDMHNAYSIKSSGVKFKLKRNDKTFVEVKPKEAKTKIYVNDELTYIVKGGDAQYLAVLAVPGSDLVLGSILLTELTLARLKPTGQ